MRRITPFLFPLLLFTSSLHAQSFTSGPCNGDEGNTSNDSWFFGHPQKVCELRKTVLPLVNGQLRVSNKNGGIEVVGEDRKDIALEARVVAQGSSREEAQSIERQIKILTDGTIQADGPSIEGWSRRGWYVNYRLHVPRHVTVHLHAENGGIDIAHLDGSISAETTNGGLSLADLAGDVHVSTVNGGLDVSLQGSQWHGNGISAQTTNGGVSVKAPDHYSAHLVAETVNGGISVGFPVTIQGRIGNHIDTNLGSGGPTLQFKTVNGPILIDRD